MKLSIYRKLAFSCDSFALEASERANASLSFAISDFSTATASNVEGYSAKRFYCASLLSGAKGDFDTLLSFNWVLSQQLAFKGVPSGLAKASEKVF